MTGYPQRCRIVVPLLAAGLIAGAVIAGDPVEAPETPLPVRLELELTDGARLIGTAEPVLPVHTAYARLEIPLKLVSTVGFDLEKEQVVLNFSNGDRLTGVPAFESVTLNTLAGKLAIGIEHIVRLHVRPEIEITAAPGLILRYTFEGDTGARVTDRSGAGHHGTAHNVTYRDLPGGRRAAEFHNGYIDSPVLSEMGFGAKDDFTIAFWWQPRDLTVQNFNLVGARREADGARGLQLAFEFGRQYYLHLQLARWSKYTVAVSQHQWVHSTLLRSGGQWRIFHDGRELSITSSMGWPVDAGPLPDKALRFGMDQVGVGQRAFHGAMTDIRFYRRAIALDEIAQLAADRPQ